MDKKFDKNFNNGIYNDSAYFEEPDENFPLDVIFTNLDNISKINVGDKLTHDNKYITVDVSYVKSVTRWYYNISRLTILDFINKILEESYKHLELLKRNKSETSGILWVKLISRLKQSANGLVKLRQTYSTDEEFCKKLDSCIKKLLKYI
jgi:hypothetical protein